MRCSVRISSGTGVIHSWSDDAKAIIEATIQPLPHQFFSKRYETTQLRAFNIAKFLREHGVNVDTEIDNPSEHARLTVWTEKLAKLRTSISVDDVEEFVSAIGIEYRELQKRALRKLLQSHFALLAVGCGGGKTLLNLSLCQFKKRIGPTMMVIVAPSACSEEYMKELKRFRGYFDLSMTDTCGLSVRDAKEEIESTISDIVIVSVDSIVQLQNTVAQKLQNFDGETILIVEEGHSIKNVSSKRSRGVQFLAPLFDQVVVSTATPLPLGPKDLRGYVGLVGLPQPEEAYAEGIPETDGQLLRGIAFVTDEDDVPFGPLATEQIEYSDLEDLNRKIFDEVSTELRSGNKVVIFTSTNRAVESAFNLFPNVSKTVLSGTYYVESSKDNQMRVGRCKEAQKTAVEQFNFDPDCRILIANYRVGSTGLNLQYSGARMAIFYEITNSGADFFQSKYRIRRPNVFPEQGFRYVYALPLEPQLRRTVNRQFLKLADQQATLREIKSHSARAL